MSWQGKLGVAVMVVGAIGANAVAFLEWLERRATKIPIRKAGQRG